MNGYNLEIFVVDFEDVGQDAIEQMITDGHVHANILHTTKRDIGPWCDEHPLNHTKTARAEIERLFDGVTLQSLQIRCMALAMLCRVVGQALDGVPLNAPSSLLAHPLVQKALNAAKSRLCQG